MDETEIRRWQVKLHARLHDPAEKALVLLRDPAGHEGGTSRALQRLLGLARQRRCDAVDANDLHTPGAFSGVPRSSISIDAPR